jgi:hypothetical protein
VWLPQTWTGEPRLSSSADTSDSGNGCGSGALAEFFRSDNSVDCGTGGASDGIMQSTQQHRHGALKGKGTGGMTKEPHPGGKGTDGMTAEPKPLGHTSSSCGTPPPHQWSSLAGNGDSGVGGSAVVIGLEADTLVWLDGDGTSRIGTPCSGPEFYSDDSHVGCWKSD